MNINKNIIVLISLIVILLVLIIIVYLFSDKSGSVSYQELVNDGSDGYSDIVVSGSNYLVLSSTTDDIIKSSLTMYDKNDEMVWSNSYSYQEYDTYLTEIEIYEDSYIGIGYYCDLEENISSLIVKFDSSGNVLKESVFTYYNDNYYTDVLIDDDKIVVVGHSYNYDDDKTTSFIEIYNSNLKMTDEQYINDVSFNAIEKSSDNYVIVGTNDSLGEDKKGRLIVVNSSLKIVDDITYEEKSEFNDISVVDSGYIVVGTITESDDDNYDALIVKYDYDGNFVWSNVLGGNNIDYYSKVITISDSNVLVVGTIYSSDIEANTEGLSRGVIVEYDNGGNIVFSDYYGVGEVYYSFNNITIYDEDEYYISGIYDASYGLIVKFSAN